MVLCSPDPLSSTRQRPPPSSSTTVSYAVLASVNDGSLCPTLTHHFLHADVCRRLPIVPKPTLWLLLSLTWRREPPSHTIIYSLASAAASIQYHTIRCASYCGFRGILSSPHTVIYSPTSADTFLHNPMMNFTPSLLWCRALARSGTFTYSPVAVAAFLHNTTLHFPPHVLLSTRQ